ncbi:MAG: hypothetical protein KA149_13480 [Chitinophagales bacterium]|nr:hypothetical protein [Chitinophagales bacterium]
MKTDNDQKKVIEKFDRSKERTGGDKVTKNPATSNNVPFDEGQFEEPQKGLVEDEDNEEEQRKNQGKDIHEEKGDLGI